MRAYTADLHIHTCLSPCAEIVMSPARIIQRAQLKGLDILGICDHNSCENAEIALRLARQRNMWVLPGMEVTTAEEIHVLTLFDRVQQAETLQEIVYNRLPQEENDPATIGYQLAVNEFDEILSFNNRFLIGATDISIEELADIVNEMNGLIIFSHIDRDAFSVLSQLGFIPEHIGFDGVEFSPLISLDSALERYKTYCHIPWIFSSDAHRLEDIGQNATQFLIDRVCISAMKEALAQARQRLVYQLR